MNVYVSVCVSFNSDWIGLDWNNFVSHLEFFGMPACMHAHVSTFDYYLIYY